LCNEVYNVENIIETRGTNQAFIDGLIGLRQKLADAAETLGYARPGEVMNIDAQTPAAVEEVQHGRSA
jgi:hypothetical protein